MDNYTVTETTRIENKLKLTSELDIEKEVIAFLNYKEGGYIYIGIDKEGNTVGVEDIDDCMLRLKDRIKNNISPSAMGLFDISEERKDGRSVVKVTIASGIEKPYFKTKYGMTSKGAFIRVGTSAEPMPQEMIDRQTAATITPMERIETPLWDKVALREAVINAMVHNDYSFEVPPKFEIFPDRIEITSAGRLPESLSREEFFSGISIPRNKELMRIYRDVELVESLGSGIPRILRAYGEECFTFTDNFIRITFPANLQHGTKSAPSWHQVGTKSALSEIDGIERLIDFCGSVRSMSEMLSFMNLKDRTKFRKKYINPLMEAGILEMTIPDKPNSQLQKYRLTPLGLQMKESSLNKAATSQLSQNE